MSAEERIDGRGGHTRAIPVSIEQPPDPRWHRFAMRMALGASVTEASHRAGVSRTTGYEWVKEMQVQRLIDEYGQEAANRARRELAGLVRQAVRTVRELLKDASPKGSPTRFEAARKVLEWNRIDLVPAAQVERRILTYVPRGDREAGEIQVPDDQLDARALDAPIDLPTRPGEDGLPADFPRHPDGSVDLGHATYYGPDHKRLADPQFWADDPGRRTMRRYEDQQPGDPFRGHRPE